MRHQGVPRLGAYHAELVILYLGQQIRTFPAPDLRSTEPILLRCDIDFRITNS